MSKSKKRILLEYELNASSPTIVWPLLSEATGLERWIADKVERNGDKLKFTWGTSWQNKDERSATIIKEEKDKLIRFKWDEDEDPKAYCELKIEIGEITNDCVLAVTDFAESDDIDSLKELWDDNMELLHQASGIESFRKQNYNRLIRYTIFIQ